MSRTSGAASSVAFVVRGDLDAFAAAELRRDLIGAQAAGCTELSVDLQDVRFTDASALGVLARAWRDLESPGVRLRLVGASDSVRRVRAAARLTAQLPDVPLPRTGD